MEILTIDGRRDYYSAKQCAEHTMTVGELISELECYDEDMPVMLNNDGGYTFGKIRSSSFATETTEDTDGE